MTASNSLCNVTKQQEFNIIDGKQSIANENGRKSRLGFFIGGVFGVTGALLMAIATPFVLPALRRYCLPYVPATETQLGNLSKAFRKYSKQGDTFLDIGSGDGRVCQTAAKLGIYSSVNGVELNYILVLYSRMSAMFSGQSKILNYHRGDLWKHNLGKYDSICVFGVDTMMSPLESYLRSCNVKQQTIFACRFPFEKLYPLEEFGDGIDTVWVYRLDRELVNKNCPNR